jgi:FkbM family methyltransferase
VRRLWGIRIAGVTGFSEFHSIGDFVTPVEHSFLASYPVGSGVILDVGANLGLVSCIMARRFPDRPIYAFEPNPSTFASLTANVELNACRNVRPEALAVAGRDGTALFDANPLSRGTVSLLEAEGAHTAVVACTTLDTHAERHGIESIGFLKVDVEGFEAEVFRGAQQLLSGRRVEVIYYEVCPANSLTSHIDPRLPTMLLESHGYRIYRIGHGARLEPTDLGALDETVSENWVALLS